MFAKLFFREIDLKLDPFSVAGIKNLRKVWFVCINDLFQSSLKHSDWSD